MHAYPKELDYRQTSDKIQLPRTVDITHESVEEEREVGGTGESKGTRPIDYHNLHIEEEHKMAGTMYERDPVEVNSLQNILRQALTSKQESKEEIIVNSISGTSYLMNKSVDLPSKIHHNKTA